MYMKIDGVLGDSKSFKYKGWADVTSWNWGMTSNRKQTNGKDGDKTSLNELSIIKSIGIDSSSIRLLYAQGKIIPNVELNITPILGKREVQTKYVNLRMENVLIKSIVTGGSIEDAFFKEHITLIFDRIRFEYSLDALSSDAGSGDTSENIDFRWNVPGNMEWEH
jgi:type VI secretion system secreted protein Hcp